MASDELRPIQEVIGMVDALGWDHSHYTAVKVSATSFSVHHHLNSGSGLDETAGRCDSGSLEGFRETE